MPRVKFEYYAQGTWEMDGRCDWFVCGGVFVVHLRKSKLMFQNYDSVNVKGWIYLE